MLNDRLKTLIQTLKIKKSEFAEKIDFSQAYISLILSGSKKNPSNRFYKAIQKQFNVNEEWLKNGNGEMFKVDNLKFSPSEKDLITKYNSLSFPERKIIDEVVSALFLKHIQESNVGISI